MERPYAAVLIGAPRTPDTVPACRAVEVGLELPLLAAGPPAAVVPAERPFVVVVEVVTAPRRAEAEPVPRLCSVLGHVAVFLRLAVPRRLSAHVPVRNGSFYNFCYF